MLDMTAVFNTRAKMALIRLFASREKGFHSTGRAAARLVKLSPPGAHAALKELHAAKILTREVVGRQHVYALNMNERFVKDAVVPFVKKALGQRSISRNPGKKRKG